MIWQNFYVSSIPCKNPGNFFMFLLFTGRTREYFPQTKTFSMTICRADRYLTAAFVWQSGPQPPWTEQRTCKKEDKASTGQHYCKLTSEVPKGSGAALFVALKTRKKPKPWCITWTLVYIALSSFKHPPNHSVQWETTYLLEDTKPSLTFGQSWLLFL